MKIELIIILLIVSWQTAFTQVRVDEDGSIENTEIVIEKNKKIVFPEVKRNIEKVNPPKKNTDNSEGMEYQYKDINAPVPDLDPKIKIATIKDELAARKKANYIKIGGGNYGTSYGEGQYLKTELKKYQIGIYGRHLASALGPVKYSATSANKLEVFGHYYLKKALINGNIGYNRNVYHFYGYRSDSVPDNASQIRQIIPQFYIAAGIEKVDTNPRFNYSFQNQYSIISNRFNARENEYTGDLRLGYKIDNISRIILHSSLSASQITDSTSLSRNLFTLRPEYERDINEKFTIKGGLNVAVENDTVKNTNRVHVYPVVNAQYQLFEKLQVFGGIDGGMEKNTLRSYLNQNPWLTKRVNLVHTNKRYEFYAGLQGNLTNYIFFKISPSYARYQNLYFFVNDSLDPSKFDVEYERKGTDVVKIQNELSYQPTQVFKLGAKATYYSYSMQQLEKAWHRPGFELTLYGNYNLFDKLAIELDIFYISGIIARDYTVKDRQKALKEIIDLNLSATYKITDRLSSYLYLYNILNQNYYRYNNYQSKGINVLLGITYAF